MDALLEQGIRPSEHCRSVAHAADLEARLAPPERRHRRRDIHQLERVELGGDPRGHDTGEARTVRQALLDAEATHAALPQHRGDLTARVRHEVELGALEGVDRARLRVRGNGEIDAVLRDAVDLAGADDRARRLVAKHDEEERKRLVRPAARRVAGQVGEVALARDQHGVDVLLLHDGRKPPAADGHLLRDGLGWKLNWHAGTVVRAWSRVNTSPNLPPGARRGMIRRAPSTQERCGWPSRFDSTARDRLADVRLPDDFLTAGGDGQLWLEGVAADDLVRALRVAALRRLGDGAAAQLPRDPRGFRGATGRPRWTPYSRSSRTTISRSAA